MFRPATLDDWPQIRAGLEQILKRCPDTWIPEDVYLRMRQNHAFAYMTSFGFFIVEIVIDSNRPSHRRLNVWCLYSTNPRLDPVLIKETVEKLDALAKEALCGGVTFASPRHGWERYLQDYFKPVLIRYERVTT